MNITLVNNTNFAKKIGFYKSKRKEKKIIFDIYPQEALLKELKKNRAILLDKLAFCKNETDRKKILNELNDLGKRIKDIES